jgi:hypothetical protein
METIYSALKQNKQIFLNAPVTLIKYTMRGKKYIHTFTVFWDLKVIDHFMWNVISSFT